MIRITIEILSARTGKTSLLATGTISNDVVRSQETQGSRGSYNVVLNDKAGRLWKTGRVENFPRKQLLAWDLLTRALNNILGNRNS